MSELTLYRKYRPKDFDTVLGQEQVTTVLQNAIAKGSITHAYLFAGSRGTGKTSVARIFANAIGTTATDTYEIDAASNRGVEEVRAIREAVHTLPFESKHKVYILDEAHMLTKEAWNALLKTLEEPPKHVIFIMATTELEKVPETVLSRCQVFIFKKPTLTILKSVIEDIAKWEGYSLEKGAVELIALLGDGSFRDTESILQKILSASKDTKISLEEVELITGAPKGKLISDVLLAIEHKKLNESLVALSEVGKENLDPKLFLRLLLARMRTVMLLRFASEMEEEIKASLAEQDFEVLKKIADTKTSSINSKTLDELLRAYEEMSFAVVKMLPVELALIRLLGEK